jgi:hypothetical protein
MQVHRRVQGVCVHVIEKSGKNENKNKVHENRE